MSTFNVGKTHLWVSVPVTKRDRSHYSGEIAVSQCSLPLFFPTIWVLLSAEVKTCQCHILNSPTWRSHKSTVDSRCRPRPPPPQKEKNSGLSLLRPYSLDCLNPCPWKALKYRLGVFVHATGFLLMSKMDISEWLRFQIPKPPWAPYAAELDGCPLKKRARAQSCSHARESEAKPWDKPQEGRLHANRHARCKRARAL